MTISHLTIIKNYLRFLPTLFASINRYPQDESKVIFSFDDGPHPIFTPIILDILKSYQLKAWFFLIGSKAEKHPQLVKTIHEQGHIIGNHSWDHQSFLRQTQQATADSLAKTNNVLSAIIQEKINYVRPPYGQWHPGHLPIFQKLGLELLLWNVSSKDFKLNDQQIRQRILNGLQTKSCLLFHDGHRNSQQTISALPDIIESMKTG